MSLSWDRGHHYFFFTLNTQTPDCHPSNTPSLHINKILQKLMMPHPHPNKSLLFLHITYTYIFI